MARVNLPQPMPAGRCDNRIMPDDEIFSKSIPFLSIDERESASLCRFRGPTPRNWVLTIGPEAASRFAQPESQLQGPAIDRLKLGYDGEAKNSGLKPSLGGTMTQARLLAVASSCMLTIVAQSSKAPAHQSPGTTTSTEIAQAVRGRTCATAGGAKFSFGRNGEYSYDGLWKSDGHYEIHPGLITISLHSGLERSFGISATAGSLFFESTSVTCTGDAAIAHAH